MTIARVELKRTALVAAIVTAITALHYGTSPSDLHLHVVYREMYFVPILLAALYFGKWGGIITALGTTALYAPHIAMSIRTAESTVGNTLEILFFCIFGAVIGSYVDLRRSYQRTIGRTDSRAARRSGHNVLVFIDESAESGLAAAYAGDLFGRDPETIITLLCAPAEPNPDLFGSRRALTEATTRAADAAEDGIRKASAVLRECGVAESRVNTRIVAAGTSRLSDLILREQRQGAHDAIVVFKRRMTRAQEFLFGNVAVRLVRAAPCPVLVVDEPDSKSGEI